MIRRMRFGYYHVDMDSTKTVSIDGCKWAETTALRVEPRYVHRVWYSMFESDMSHQQGVSDDSPIMPSPSTPI